jgi:hypothetical protein
MVGEELPRVQRECCVRNHTQFIRKLGLALVSYAHTLFPAHAAFFLLNWMSAESLRAPLCVYVFETMSLGDVR